MHTYKHHRTALANTIMEDLDDESKRLSVHKA